MIIEEIKIWKNKARNVRLDAINHPNATSAHVAIGVAIVVNL